MAPGDKEFCARVADRLVAMGPVRPRAMFGGHGLFLDGVMFGLVWRGTLYFKVGEANKGEYDAAGSEPFAYMRGNERIEMSYGTLPDDVLANSAILTEWAERSLDVARTSRRKRRR